MVQLFLLVSYLFILEFSIAIDTIMINQPVRHPEILTSKGEKFKLGFFSPADSRYVYVGVTYNIPVTMVIWVANRDRPLNDSSGTVEISAAGNLVVLDGKGETIWSSDLPNNSWVNSSAKLLDTGNLVLLDHSNSKIIWESFEHASDSFVENMKLWTDLSTNERNMLRSWRSPSDPALGNFTCTIEPVEIPETVIWNGDEPYWRSGPWNGQIFIGIQHMRSVYKYGLDIVNNQPGIVSTSFTLFNSSDLLHYMLNSSGFFIEKVWFPEKNEWEVTWLSMKTECDFYGKCGPFGRCDPKSMPICTCFPGFEPNNKDEWDRGNWTRGCIRKSALLCERNNSLGGLGKEDGFIKMKNVKVPDHLKWFPFIEAECRSQCLKNCSCIAYAYSVGIGCMFWMEGLIDVQQFASSANGGADLYIRLADSELGDWSKRSSIIIAIAVTAASVTILLCIYVMWKLFLNRRETGKFHVKYSKQCTSEDKLEELPLFKFEMLSKATANFDDVNKLGQGGFGPVHKGKLPDGQEIAVKRLAKSSNQGMEEFMNEVEVISKLQHRNLVRLLGCCIENEEKILVYEYMSSGSLDAYLFDIHKRDFLDWSQRVIIIEGICRGLQYLHRDSRLPIIHRDLKASNILLDEDLYPKISDFGLARIFDRKEDQINTTRVAGTLGYMSPEYILNGSFSEKSDVYSFGVLLLEVISGKKNTSFYNERGDNLVAYTWSLWNEGNISDLVDIEICDSEMKAEIQRYIHVGLLCVEQEVKFRPDISTVLLMLSSETIELPWPKQPAFSNQSTSALQLPQKRSSKYSVNEVSLTVIGGR